jgi:hypothetical protein
MLAMMPCWAIRSISRPINAGRDSSQGKAHADTGAFEVRFNACLMH